ncbi:nucleotide-binding protein [Chryseobacterium sp. CFBP8996]|nr:nucleotide-binding protein [Chryseobacterium sp. CFBP8996]MDY0931115.1 nucleotide-binding protein [Chryseobacterium sp. CFBP8996]
MKPELFIGSSVEGLDIAEAIQSKLNHNFNINLWTDGVFNIGSTTIDDLIEQLNKSDFGIFVFSDDDISKIRGVEYSTVRDNVLYELGLYTGKLGRYNTFIIKPSNSSQLHLPSDLTGIYVGVYDSSQIGNPESAVSSFCSQIKRQIFNNTKNALGGKWILSWNVTDSNNIKHIITEELDVFHYRNTIKFLHIFEKQNYIFSGEFKPPYFTGVWKDTKGIGYEGTFQMKLNGQANKFEGMWIGWSNGAGIKSDICSLTKL